MSDCLKEHIQTLEECQGKSVEYFISLTDEDYSNLLARVDLINQWMHGIGKLREALERV
mgnify:CR=1 FL=1